MSEKKVANMHTKPRGKGQCSPEQTCPEVPLVLYRFLTLTHVIFVFVDKWQKMILTSQSKISCL